MKQPLTLAATVGLATFVAPACSARPTNLPSDARAAPVNHTAKGMNVTNDQRPVSERFNTLDDYLLWLKNVAAPTDRAWYKEIRPGVFELQTGNFRPLEGTPGAQQRVFTREELERKFGFRK